MLRMLYMSLRAAIRAAREFDAALILVGLSLPSVLPNYYEYPWWAKQRLGLGVPFLSFEIEIHGADWYYACEQLWAEREGLA